MTQPKLLTKDYLREFILAALTNTYAADAGQVAAGIAGTKQLEYTDGVLRYTDIYTGFDPFQGFSLVTTVEGGTVLWSMTYNGFCLNASHDKATEIYAFLKQARLTAYREDALFPREWTTRSLDRQFEYSDNVAHARDRIYDGRETIMNVENRTVAFLMMYTFVFHVSLL